MLPVLDFIHNKNVIHRDIKPENILRRKTPLDPSIYGKISDLVLIDFGVSKQVSTSVMTKVGTIVGTPAYSAPEQTRGIVSPSSDLYSLAVTAIRLLTGVLPEERNGSLLDEIFNINHFTWIWKEWLSKNGLSVSNNLANILDKMLANKISDRFQSAKEVLEVLQTPVSSPQPQPTIKLKTSKADFTLLDILLSAGKWKEADLETGKIMCKIMDREKFNWLDDQNCKDFPSNYLKIIDDLWLKYSNNHFGFSIQKEIYIKVGGIAGVYQSEIYQKFADLIGWRKDEKWLNYDNLNFNFNSPLGHLPCLQRARNWWGLDWNGCVIFIFARLV